MRTAAAAAAISPVARMRPGRLNNARRGVIWHFALQSRIQLRVQLQFVVCDEVQFAKSPLLALQAVEAVLSMCLGGWISIPVLSLLSFIFLQENVLILLRCGR